jgi:AbiTii
LESLVTELQKAAINEAASVAALLRMARTVATKLDLQEALSWIVAESNGYKDASHIPDYRRIRVIIKFFNPIAGWLPIHFQQQDLEDLYCNQIEFAPIGRLEDLISRVTKDGGTISRPLPAGAYQFIANQISITTQIDAFVDTSTLQTIVEAVRNRILEWALALEKEGILGEGMTFSSEEKRQASESPTTINVGSISNFAGSLGGSVVRQSIDAYQVTVSDFPSRVRAFIDDLEQRLAHLPSDETRSIVKATDDVKAELNKDKPKESLLKKGLRKISAAAVSLSSYVLQATISAEIGKLLAGPGP